MTSGDHRLEQFRLLSPNDAASVMDILKGHADASKDFTHFGLNLNSEQIKKSLKEDLVFGLFEFEKLVAFIIGRTINEKIFEIDMTMTLVKKAQKGFMTRLFQESIKFLKNQMNLEEVWLEVHEENFAAISFYKKIGFFENTRRPRYYPDGKGAILMTLRWA